MSALVGAGRRRSAPTWWSEWLRHQYIAASLQHYPENPGFVLQAHLLRKAKPTVAESDLPITESQDLHNSKWVKSWTLIPQWVKLWTPTLRETHETCAWLAQHRNPDTLTLVTINLETVQILLWDVCGKCLISCLHRNKPTCCNWPFPHLNPHLHITLLLLCLQVFKHCDHLVLIQNHYPWLLQADLIKLLMSHTESTIT